MFYNIRDYVLNHIAVWCINHCHNWSSIFYAACKQLCWEELEVMANSAIQAKKEGY